MSMMKIRNKCSNRQPVQGGRLLMWDDVKNDWVDVTPQQLTNQVEIGKLFVGNDKLCESMYGLQKYPEEVTDGIGK